MPRPHNKSKPRRKHGRVRDSASRRPGWWWAYCTKPRDENDKPFKPTKDGQYPVLLPSGQAVYIQSHAMNPHGAATFRPASFFEEARVANRDHNPNALDSVAESDSNVSADIPATPPSVHDARRNCLDVKRRPLTESNIHTWSSTAAPWASKLGCAAPSPTPSCSPTSKEPADEGHFLYDLNLDTLCLDVTIDIEHDPALAGEVTLATVQDFVLQQPAHHIPTSDSSASETLSLCSDGSASGGRVLSKRERRRENRRAAEQQRKNKERQERRKKQQKYLAKRDAKLQRRAIRLQHAATLTGPDEVDRALRELGLLDATTQPCVAA